MSVVPIGTFAAYLAADQHLAVLVTTRPDKSEPYVAIVNAAVIAHPLSDDPVLAFVARRGVKLTNLARHPSATLVARDGWEWAAARGSVELCGPDNPLEGIDEEHQQLLLRDIYHAAGGRHPNLNNYDSAMKDERRCAVLITPKHIWTNPLGAEHREPTNTNYESKP